MPGDLRTLKLGRVTGGGRFGNEVREEVGEGWQRASHIMT